MMWQMLCRKIQDKGGSMEMNAEAFSLRHENGRITRLFYRQHHRETILPLRHLFSSAPLPQLIAMLTPSPPPEILLAAERLSYRSFVIVVLIVNRSDLFCDQWLYVHSPRVEVARIQNFKNWSPCMVPDPGTTSLGFEYFCTENDPFWKRSDAEWIAKASAELSLLKIARADSVIDATVVRQANAYPVYDPAYRESVDSLKRYLGSFKNLQTIGRNGLHRYNNMDHAMQTGILAARNLDGAGHDLWTVNEDRQYLEAAPLETTEEKRWRATVGHTFARMDVFSFGLALGLYGGLALFCATLWLVLKGGPVVGPTLELLEHYFFGYSVTFAGAFIALGYGFVWGFMFGWLFAYLRNLLLAFYLYRVKKKNEMFTLRDFFDHF